MYSIVILNTHSRSNTLINITNNTATLTPRITSLDTRDATNINGNYAAASINDPW